MSGNGRSGVGLASGDVNQIINSTGNSSGPSVGASSLVTDANSSLSGGPQMQRSTSFNNESYMRLPASPMSFSSNISGTSVMDGCSAVQQNPLHEQVQKHGLSTATSQLTQEPSNLVNAQKRPRFDVRNEDVLQKQLIQQLLQRQEPMQAQSHQNPQLQAMLQQQRLIQCQQQQQQQQQMMQSFSQMQRGPVTLQQQQQLRLQAFMQPANPIKRPFDNGICSRRLMQYLYHQRHRPQDNSISYWRKFVAEYFAARAKKRWCLSLYDNIGNHALGVFPQLAVDSWQCDVCGSKAGKGFEATFEVLPRLFQIKFDRGVIDENLFLGIPHECRLSSGIMVLKYEKAVQESVYEHLRIVREGQLRIVFTPELKILCWEFCARRHEEFLPRRLLAPQYKMTRVFALLSDFYLQDFFPIWDKSLNHGSYDSTRNSTLVNQLLQVAQKYQAAVSETNTAGVSHQELQASCNMFAAAGCQLARNLDLQSLNDLGFSKRYVRCLQVSEVVSSMKDLIDFSQEQKIGPIESLRNYPSLAAAKLQKQKLEAEQLMSAHNLSGDPSAMSKVVGIHPRLNNYVNTNLSAGEVVNSSQQSIDALNSYQNMLRNSLNSKQNMLQQEALNFTGSKHSNAVKFQGSALTTMTSTSGQQYQPSVEGCSNQQSNLQPAQGNQHVQQQVIQQMLQEMINKGTAQPAVTPNANGNLASRDVIGYATNGTSVNIETGPIGNAVEIQNMPANLPNNNSTEKAASRNNGFMSAVTASNPTITGNNLTSRSDLHQNMDLAGMDDIDQDFLANVMFDGDSW